MWAGILAFFASLTSLSKILEVLEGFVRLIRPSTTEKIEKDKESLDKEIENSDKTGRP